MSSFNHPTNQTTSSTAATSVFEWCTSPSILIPLITPLLSFLTPPLLIIDVGCGSSLCGIELVKSLTLLTRNATVEMISCDVSPSCIADCRLKLSSPTNPNLKWLTADIGIAVDEEDDDDMSDGPPQATNSGVYFNEDSFSSSTEDCIKPLFSLTPNHQSNQPRYASLILDKTTLDFLLAAPLTLSSSSASESESDPCKPYTAAAGWLYNIRTCLSPNKNGIYFLCSFHSPDFIIPILNLTFNDGDVKWTSVSRTEGDGDLNNIMSNLANSRWKAEEVFVPPQRYTSGGEEDEVYCYACTLGTINAMVYNVENVREEIESFTNDYYTSIASMITPERIEELNLNWKQRSASSLSAGGEKLGLVDVYMVLFTGVERDVYGYVDFTGDCYDFFKGKRESMTVDEAVEFLRAMQ